MSCELNHVSCCLNVVQLELGCLKALSASRLHICRSRTEPRWTCQLALYVCFETSWISCHILLWRLRNIMLSMLETAAAWGNVFKGYMKHVMFVHGKRLKLDFVTGSQSRGKPTVASHCIKYRLVHPFPEFSPPFFPLPPAEAPEDGGAYQPSPGRGNTTVHRSIALERWPGLSLDWVCESTKL